MVIISINYIYLYKPYTLERTLPEDDNNPHIISLLPDGSSMQYVDRDSGKRSGGVALVYGQAISSS